MRSPIAFRLLTVAATFGVSMAVPQIATGAVSFVVSVGVAPPPLPVYAQPICPGPGFLWTPGYWAYGPGGYRWIAGAWVRPPAPGVLWTPAWWGMEDGHYRFHAGYWGPRVGYYGGVRYGFGYPGSGFEGGEWRGHDFFYNSAAWHVDEVHMRNLYRHEDHFADRRFEAEHRGFDRGEHRGFEERERRGFEQGEHRGFDRGEHRGEFGDHRDNGNHNGWDHDDHGHGRGHGRDR